MLERPAMPVTLTVNGKKHVVTADGDKPLL